MSFACWRGEKSEKLKAVVDYLRGSTANRRMSNNFLFFIVLKILRPTGFSEGEKLRMWKSRARENFEICLRSFIFTARPSESTLISIERHKSWAFDDEIDFEFSPGWQWNWFEIFKSGTHFLGAEGKLKIHSLGAASSCGNFSTFYSWGKWKSSFLVQSRAPKCYEIKIGNMKSAFVRIFRKMLKFLFVFLSNLIKTSSSSTSAQILRRNWKWTQIHTPTRLSHEKGFSDS